MYDPAKQKATHARYRERHREKLAAYGATHRVEAASRSRRWREADPDRAKAVSVAYAAAHREERKAKQRIVRQADLGRSNTYQAGWRAAHPQSVRAADASYRERHRDELRAKWSANAARRRGAPRCDHLACLALDPSALAWQANEPVCYLCGVRLIPGAKRGEEGHAQLDHVIPIARGGIHCADNLKPACGPCNIRKAAKVPTPVNLTAVGLAFFAASFLV